MTNGFDFRIVMHLIAKFAFVKYKTPLIISMENQLQTIRVIYKKYKEILDEIEDLYDDVNILKVTDVQDVANIKPIELKNTIIIKTSIP